MTTSKRFGEWGTGGKAKEKIQGYALTDKEDLYAGVEKYVPVSTSNAGGIAFALMPASFGMKATKF